MHNLAEVDAVCDRVVMIARGRLVASGTMDDLRRRGAGRERWRIECDRVELSVLSQVAGVHGVHAEPAGEGWFAVSMEIDHAHSEDARVSVARAIAAGGGVVRLMSRSDEPLEEVFARVATEANP
jgi:ABC-2 type transport system ATP-binding protein